MRESQIRDLRKETEHMFYHGFDNYMKHAFPEDELRPLTCRPLTRDRLNPAHIELNDVLGNYSLTLIDSLSTLAIMSSSESAGSKAWLYFQDGVSDFVKLYGDGSDGPSGRGERSRGFDIDSKVQVFETVIRGLGGLLSAHLFAVGDLPIRGYAPPEEEATFAKAWDKRSFFADSHGIKWDNGFVYDGQLLRLAVDLGNRILPAFYTQTGLPYPRVNLRHGVQFYANSPLHAAFSDSRDEARGNRRQLIPEITETCSAGAGSLVLEFTVLSRLTGDGRYEELAKRAFWAVWARRSDIGLIGAGIDAESGRWVNSYTGIGAGIDSFFEYAFKSYVLLSSGQRPEYDSNSPWSILDGYYTPLSDHEHSADAFLEVWRESQASIKRHLYRGAGYQHPHFIQGDIYTGATRAFWIDSLSAYYPGLLTLAGEIDEASKVHLLATALWTRFSALPERWNVATGNIENGLSWWGGRPEFVESTYYLYRATKDPWYLHVGEMVLRDIKRRCWTKCGWAGLQDVRTGELSDRMESFFLGETAKYMFLLYDPSHPLNALDAPFVFSTEGHPLIIPKAPTTKAATDRRPAQQPHEMSTIAGICQKPPIPPSLTGSSTAARGDLFHAASLARLHLMPSRGQVEGAILDYASDHPSVSLSDLSSPSNYTLYPWTLPPELVPYDATSAPMAIRPTLDISFPPLPSMVLGPGSLERIRDGILIKSIGGLRLGLIQDVPPEDMTMAPSVDSFRIQVINNLPLGKDEKVYLSRETVFDILNPADPNFTRIRDSTMLDIVVDVSPEISRRRNASTAAQTSDAAAEHRDTLAREQPLSSYSDQKLGSAYAHASSVRAALSTLMDHVSSMLRDDPATSLPSGPSQSKVSTVRLAIPAITSAGRGSGPLPDVEEATLFSQSGKPSPERLTWSTIYFSDETCDERLPLNVVRNHQVIVMKRGGCSFSQKLKNLPAFRPGRSALQIVIVVSYDEMDDVFGMGHSRSDPSVFDESAVPALLSQAAVLAGPYLSRPHLDEFQVTAGGTPRQQPVSMVMVGGGDDTYELLRSAAAIGIKRRYHMRSQGIPISNLYII
ncbi:CAZyme family GH47 [Paecilomyces variotii]|nr:CAZyme family GH47 [Paecilomyces variotii]